MLKWSIWLLPALLHSGVALQAVGVYLLLLALAWEIRQSPVVCSEAHRNLAKTFGTLGLCLVGVWLLFPLSNIIVWLTAGSDAPVPLPDLPLKRLMRSHAPSTVIVTGLMFTLGAVLLKRKVSGSSLGPHGEAPSVQSRQGQPVHGGLLDTFVLSSALWTSVFFVYFLVQFITGVDLRSDSGSLPPSHQMASGFWRVKGFYGHPLSMSAIALAEFSFFASLTLQGLSAARKFNRLLLLSSGLVVLHFLLLVFSGGRTALAVGLVVFGLLFLWHIRSVLKLRWILILGGVFAGVSAAAVWISGLATRVLELVAGDPSTWVDRIDRLKFWRVHLQILEDYPLFGLGYAWTKEGALQRYYESLGYADLQKKYWAHNVFIQTLADLGFVGTLALGALLVIFFRRLFRWLAEASSTSTTPSAMWSLPAVGAAVGAGLVANLLHGLTQNTFFDANVVAVYMGFIVLLVACRFAARSTT